MSLTNSPIWFGSGATGGGFYDYEIDNSLRFNDDDSAYLSRIPSSASNRKTWTFSAWIKLGSLSQGERGIIFQSNVGLDYGGPTIYQDSGLRFAHAWDPSGTDYIRETVSLFRDTSAWYHVVWWCDTTQAGTRWKIYVNGTEQTLQTPSGNNGEPAQNTDLNINSTNTHTIGNFLGNYFDGYMAEVNFIDGQALDATNFGETKSGVWIPKAYGGSYGTNGFYIDFSNNSTATNLGLDSSGNSNNWSVNNIATTDQMIDTPTNNFATWNPIWKYVSTESWGQTGTTLEGNLRWNGNSGNEVQSGIAATFQLPTTGKWYWECIATSEPSTSISWLGIIDEDTNVVKTASNTLTFGTGDIINLAFDADNQRMYFGKNGTFGAGQDPTNPTDGTSATGSGYLPYCAGNKGTGGSDPQFTANFGQDSTFAGATSAGGNTDANGVGDFKYSVPSSYLALCTANLPEPTIVDGTENFNTVLYTGNDSTQSITGVGFQPDLVWIKQRSVPDRAHRLNDSVRGANKQLYSNLTNAEGTATDELTSFDSDGFSLGSANGVNGIDTYVGWNWKAGTSFSNSAGSNGATIASSGSVNTDAGFSIVSYVGTGVAGTVYHGLTSTPEFITIKDRDYPTGRPWGSYHFKLNNGVNPEDERIQLNENTGETNDTFIFNSTAPTSNVFSLGTSSWNNTSGNDIIAYCFHSVDGYSKIGQYTGNYNVDGPFVYTGFRPAFVIIKSAVTTGYDWYMMDSTRTTYNGSQNWLSPSQAISEDTSTGENVDFLSNGFKIRTNWTRLNDSGSPRYIYLAFAENPFKYANAR